MRSTPSHSPSVPHSLLPLSLLHLTPSGLGVTKYFPEKKIYYNSLDGLHHRLTLPQTCFSWNDGCLMTSLVALRAKARGKTSGNLRKEKKRVKVVKRMSVRPEGRKQYRKLINL